jgi:hypothetical protein
MTWSKTRLAPLRAAVEPTRTTGRMFSVSERSPATWPDRDHRDPPALAPHGRQPRAAPPSCPGRRLAPRPSSRSRAPLPRAASMEASRRDETRPTESPRANRDRPAGRAVRRVWTVVSLVAPEVALQKYHSPGPWKCGWAWLHRRSFGKKLTGPSGKHRVGVSTLLKGGKICYLPRSAAISNDMV